MQVQIQKWGNSLAVRIPRSFAAETKMAQGMLVELTLSKGTLVLTPVREAEETLEDLLARVTEESLHGEVDPGGAVGDESW